MVSLPIYIVDEVATIVSKVDAALYGKLGKHISYMHGHPLEIVTRLQSMTGTSQEVKKYPLVALFQDFREKMGDRGFYGSAGLNLIIANETKPEYDSDDRYVNSFKPVLYPIYQELVNQFYQHRGFVFKTRNIPHTKIDRLFWGKEGLYGNTGNIFNDYLDCIEIQNFEITVEIKDC